MNLHQHALKIFWGIFIFTLLLTNQCFGQLGRPLSVTILHESKTIDKLLDRALKDENKSDSIVQKRLKDSCISIEMFRSKTDTGICNFQLVRNSKAAINFRVNVLLHHNHDFGYFTYKGMFVLVAAFGDYGSFFSPMPYSKSFPFIYYSNERVTDDEEYGYVLHYTIAKGQISVEGPPKVDLLIK